MKPFLCTTTFAVGFVIALHFAMSAAIGEAVKNVRMSNAVFWLVGAAMEAILALYQSHAEGRKIFLPLPKSPDVRAILERLQEQKLSVRS